MVNSMMPFQALQDGWFSFSLNKEITKFGDMWFWQSLYVTILLCMCLEKALETLIIKIIVLCIFGCILKVVSSFLVLLYLSLFKWYLGCIFKRLA